MKKEKSILLYGTLRRLAFAYICNKYRKLRNNY